jgi:hypothetical protein
MIDHLHKVIKTIIETKIDYYPIAVALDLKNKLRLDLDIKIDDFPSSAMMVLRYDIKLNKMLEEKKISSYCIAVNTLTSKDPKSKATDTIAFVTKKDPDKEAEIIFYSYTLNKNGKFEVTDIWEN